MLFTSLLAPSFAWHLTPLSSNLVARYQGFAMLTSTSRSKWQSSFPFSHPSSSQRLLYGVRGGSYPGLSCLQCFLADHYSWFSFRATNSFIPSVMASDVLNTSYRFYFFAENVFYIFILPLMPSYRAYRRFKLIAWTTSNWEHLLKF